MAEAKTTQIPDISFTLQQMKEQAGVLYNVINEIRPILNNDDEDDSAKLNRICNLIGMMYGTADFTIKKMIEDKKDSVTAKEVVEYGDQYIEFFRKANNLGAESEEAKKEVKA